MKNPFTTRLKTKTPLLFFALLCAFVFNANAQCDVSYGLIEHWKFDNNLTNSISMHTVTAVNNAYAADRLGNASSAIYLSAWNSSLLTPAPISLTNYSYSLWVKRTSTIANTWAAIGTGNGSGMPLIVCNGTNYGLNNGGGTFTYGTAASTLNVWHHLVYTKNGTTAKLYYDGALVATVTLISSFPLTYLSGYPATNETVPGNYDEYRVYDHELSASEITTIFNSTPSYTFAPVITLDPNGTSICSPQTLTLASLATGVSINYQWQKNGVNVGGATSATLSVPNATVADTGTYRVIASNTCGSDTSAGAYVGVITNQSIGSGVLFIPVLKNYGLLSTEDFSGNNLNATFTTYTPDVDVQGTANSSIILYGTDYGNVPHNNLLNVTNQITVSCWFNANNIATSQRLFDKTPVANGNNFIFDLLSSKPRFIVAGGSHTIATALNSATWYHVAATYNGAQVKIYINGILTYTGAQTGNCVSNTLPLRIGADQNATSKFTGRLDEIRIYNTALTDNDIYALYAGPKLLTVPNDRILCPNGSATLNIAGSGTGYSYQWKKNGVDIAGATAATYTDNTVTAADTGSYSCVLSRNCSNMTFASAKINFASTFNAATNLVNYWTMDNGLAPTVGGTSLTATGSTLTNDRFGVGNAALANASQFNSITLSSALLFPIQSVSFWYNYTNSATAARTLLAVGNSNILSVGPNGALYVNGNLNTGTAITAGQWQHFVMVFNGTSATLYLNGNVVIRNYTVVSSSINYFGNNGNGQSGAVGALDDVRVYNYALSQSNAFSLYNSAAFTLQPVGQSICAGASLALSVIVSGSVNYQWKKNGVVIGGATSANYNIANSLLTDSGSYVCEISSSCDGSVLSSNAAAVVVTPASPTISSATVSNNSPACGSAVTFTVVATNAIGYQWRKNGNNISGATATSYNISQVSIADNGSYDCVVSGCVSNATSSALVLTVASAILPSGLINHWKLNNNFTDGIAANNLTASGNSVFSYDRFNNNTKALYSSAAATAFTLATPIRKDTITISLWYNANVITGYKAIIGDTAGRYSDILGVANNELKWQKAGVGALPTGITISPGYWYHIVITKQGTAMKFYLNGALAYTATNPAAVPVMGAAGNAGTQINRFGNTAPIYNNQNMNGGLDDIRIYNSILTASQISSLYTEAEIYSTTNFTAACIGGSTSASVTAASLPATTYQWQKGGVDVAGATSATITINNVQAGDAGNYTCNVYSSQGCVVSTSDAITLTPGAGNVSITTQPQSQTKCVGQPATFTVATSGAAATYQWKKNGVNIAGQTSVTLNLAAVAVGDTGNYTCDIIGGSCGTISTSSAHLTVNALPVISISPATASVCTGSAVTLTASGGSPYVWSNSGGSNAAATFSPSINTTYTVTGTDANNCSASASRLVTVNAIPSASISGNAGVCPGGSTTLTASGGGTYAWSNSGGTNAAATFSPGANTTYSVTVTLNSCTATASQLVTVNAIPTAGISPSSVAICNGVATTLVASGGGTYAWSNSLGSAANQSVSPTGTTTYSVTVTNANNCTATASSTVTVNQLPTASISGASSVCTGASATLTASGGGTYAWSNSGGTNAIATFSPSANTTYTVTVTNVSNCSATASQLVSVVTVTASINGPTTICSGLSATLTASGGGTYAWNNSLGTNAAVMVSPTSATTYTVTVTNTGCSATASQTVSVQSTPTATISGASSVCAGGSVSLTANGGNTYAWSNSLGTNSTVSASPTVATTYSVTVSLGANCSASASHTVSVLQPTASSFSQTICNGDSFSFAGIFHSASGIFTDTLPNAVGCDSVITFNLTVLAPVATSISASICSGGSYDFNGDILSAAGIYTDTLQSVQSCDSVVTLTLSIATTTSITTQPVATTTVCSGNAINLNVTADGGNLVYQWVKDGSAISGANTATFNIDSSVIADAGTYKVEVSGTCGADTSDDAMVVVHATPTPTVQQAGNVLTSSASGTTYQWYLNGNVITDSIAQSLIATQSGNYKVVVTSADNCPGTSAELAVVISGINHLNADLNLNIYPNPATEFLILACDEEIETAEVYNVVGQQVIFVKGQIAKLNTALLAQGVYTLQLKTAKGNVAVKKFTKQ
jgi:hypothetical protein